MFQSYPNVILEHLGALDEVSQKCDYSMNLQHS